MRSDWLAMGCGLLCHIHTWGSESDLLQPCPPCCSSFMLNINWKDDAAKTVDLTFYAGTNQPAKAGEPTTGPVSVTHPHNQHTTG